jgi:3-methyladenine DNA glycosylase AlkD
MGTMQLKTVLAELKSMGDPEAVAGMARYGINVEQALGISIPRLQVFELIKKVAVDRRNFVKKAVNWALRQIGKRNLSLNKKAITVAEEIQQFESKTARWVAGDALRELRSENVQKRLSGRVLP